jgi:TPP-dependent pyruvate/acetoin dehydrogenase alpha subunit
MGQEALIPAERAAADAGWRRWLRGLWRSITGGRRRVPEIDYEALNRHNIPLLDTAPAPRAPDYRPQDLSQDPARLKAQMLSRMGLIRSFEQWLSEANKRGEVPTEAIHLSIGQEATAVGVCFALRPDDYIATTHRGHGHMLAKGADLDGMAAEMLAKSPGLCDGKGGSMHVTEAAVGAIGANGIVGASPLMAAGAGHSARLRGTDQVAVAFMGDGATNQGMWHEGLNFAAVFDLPAVFVVENNLYGEFTPLERHTRVPRLADRAAAYGMPGETVDGNDVWAVYEATVRAVERARRGEGPTLLECLTYRWHGHMEGDEASYRPAEEAQAWRERCPIKLWRQRLEQEGSLAATDAQRLLAEAEEQVQAAFARAVAAPPPTSTPRSRRRSTGPPRRSPPPSARSPTPRPCSRRCPRSSSATPGSTCWARTSPPAATSPSPWGSRSASAPGASWTPPSASTPSWDPPWAPP